MVKERVPVVQKCFAAGGKHSTHDLFVGRLEVRYKWMLLIQLKRLSHGLAGPLHLYTVVTGDFGQKGIKLPANRLAIGTGQPATGSLDASRDG